jgi:predicted site-specific integrase-resolvase
MASEDTSKTIPLSKFVQLVDCSQDTARAAIKQGQIKPVRNDQGHLRFGYHDVGVMRERMLRKVVR